MICSSGAFRIPTYYPRQWGNSEPPITHDLKLHFHLKLKILLLKIPLRLLRLVLAQGIGNRTHLKFKLICYLKFNQGYAFAPKAVFSLLTA